MSSQSQEKQSSPSSPSSFSAGSGSGSDGSSHSSDFDASFAEDGGPDKQQASSLQVKEVENQPYDAHVDLEDSFSDESVDTADTSGTPKMRQVARPKQPSAAADEDEDDEDDDDDDDKADSPPHGGLASPGLGKGSLSEAEEIPGATREGKAQDKEDGFNKGSSNNNNSDDDDESEMTTPTQKHHGVKLEAADDEMQQAARRAAERSALRRSGGGGDDDDNDDDDDEASESTASHSTSGKEKSKASFSGFNVSDLDHLQVPSDIKELFQYIGRYKPDDVELDTKLRCFIPDYIPAVGDIDAFVKIPRPDGTNDDLGLAVLDEPAASQSDATVLDLQLRAMSKKSVRNPMIVRSIERADKDKKAVQSWIDNIKDLHRSKPPPQVHYTKQMPDIDSLMQVWPDAVEDLLSEIQLPGPEIDLDLKDYARVACAVLDIPVYASMVEPLHVLFTLFSEFRDNQHFRNMEAKGPGTASSSNNNNNNNNNVENYFSNE